MATANMKAVSSKEAMVSRETADNEMFLLLQLHPGCTPYTRWFVSRMKDSTAE
ncbi:hypothetical protein ACP70R_016714 [Stipagrostis hirtigluma subsp. patula]